MSTLKKILVRLSAYYAPDLRALALLRIMTALVVIGDVCGRLSDLSAHYTDAGFWPCELAKQFGWKSGYWSIHLFSGGYKWELMLFILHIGFALCLLVGYRTRLFTLLVWLMTVSLHNRNAFVLQAGDDLLRLTLFWGLFLPWSACYSFDALKNRSSQRQVPLASLGYFFLLASVYAFSVALKTSPEWRSEGTAIYYALSLEQLRLPGSGDWLYAHPGLMSALTYVVFYMELFIPMLILLPSKTGKTRQAAFVLIVLLHLGIGLTLYVGLFFVINIVAALGLLSKQSIDRLERLLRLNASFSTALPKFSLLKPFCNALCTVVIVFCIIVNLSTLPYFEYELRAELDYGISALRLNQFWGMFSPGVLKKDGWLVLHGADSLGRQFDIRRNQEYVDYKKPEHIVSIYKNERWRKLAENLQNDNYTFLRPQLCTYLLAHWNERHPGRRLAALNLYFMKKETLPEYRTTPVEKQLFCTCHAY